MKNIIYSSLLMLFLSVSAQKEKEVVYLFYDKKDNINCLCKDHSNGNDKYYLNKLLYFKICDEKFTFNSTNNNVDTLNLDTYKKIKFKNIEYLKRKYQQGENFKHHTFKEIHIIERISKSKYIKYGNVYWCCEWVSE